MAGKQTGTPQASSPLGTDDFSLIKGIGPVLSQRLHEAGIKTYRQLASLSPAQLVEKVGGLSAKQIARQDWTGQADRLAPKKTRPRPKKRETQARTLHQYYENFTIELLLDEKKTMRRTRVIHIQSGDADTWAGWKTDQLIHFMACHTGARLSGKNMGKKEGFLTPVPRPNNVDTEPPPTTVSTPEPIELLPEIPKVPPPSLMAVHPVLPSSGSAGFAGILRLKDFCILPAGSDISSHSLRCDQPCQVRLTLDLTSVVSACDRPLQYKATITFKQLGGPSCIVSEMNNAFERSECVTLDLPCTAPSSGLYRPEAFVKLFSSETAIGLMASLKGDLIQVL